MRTLATALLTLLLAATAQAKGVASAEVCGPDGCAAVATAKHTELGGPAAAAPAVAEPFVRLRVKVGVPGHVESVEPLIFVPGRRIMRFLGDPNASWVEMERPGPWLAAARRVTPFGAERFPARLLAPPEPPAAPMPSAPAAADDGAFPWWVPAALLAAALLAAGTALRPKVYGLAGAPLRRGPGRARP